MLRDRHQLMADLKKLVSTSITEAGQGRAGVWCMGCAVTQGMVHGPLARNGCMPHVRGRELGQGRQYSMGTGTSALKRLKVFKVDFENLIHENSAQTDA